MSAAPNASPVVINGSCEFDTGAVTVNSSSADVLVAYIQARGRFVALDAIVGAGGALAHLKITQAMTIGGSHLPLASDTDFSAAEPIGVEQILATNKDGSVNPSPETTPASGEFQCVLTSRAAEYAIYAQKATADTTLHITGSVWPTTPAI